MQGRAGMPAHPPFLWDCGTLVVPLGQSSEGVPATTNVLEWLNVNLDIVFCSFFSLYLGLWPFPCVIVIYAQNFKNISSDFRL